MTIEVNVVPQIAKDTDGEGTNRGDDIRGAEDEMVGDFIGRQRGRDNYHDQKVKCAFLDPFHGYRCAIEDITKDLRTIVNCARNRGACKYQEMEISAGRERLPRRGISE